MTKEASLLFEIIEEKIGLTKEKILSGSRKSNIVDAKRIMSIILKKNTKFKLWEIGEEVGGLDHSCISYYIKTHKNFMDTDYSFREKFIFIESQFISRKESVEIKLKMKLRERSEINKEILRLRTLVKIKNSYQNEVDLANTISDAAEKGWLDECYKHMK